MGSVGSVPPTTSGYAQISIRGCWPTFLPGKLRRKWGGRRFEGWILFANQIEKIGIEIEVPRRDQVNNGDADALLQEGGALGDEGLPIFHAVLVGRTDDLHCRDQNPPTTLVVDEDFIVVLLTEVAFENQGRRRRRQVAVAGPQAASFCDVPGAGPCSSSS